MFDIEGKKGGDVCVIARIIHKNHLRQSDKRVNHKRCFGSVPYSFDADPDPAF
jgi:hypothetical protein